MHKSVTVETFQGLNWTAAKHDFDALAQEYGQSVSAKAFDTWCRKSSPSSVFNSHRWHSASSIRRFFDGFENGNGMLRRLVTIENARRKGKRVSMSAYSSSSPAKKKGNGANGSGNSGRSVVEKIIEREFKAGQSRSRIKALIMDCFTTGEIRGKAAEDEARKFLAS